MKSYSYPTLSSFLFTLLLAIQPLQAIAQDADSASVGPAAALLSDISTPVVDDSTQIMDAIRVFFDGLADQDSVAMMSVTDPGTRLVLTSSKADGSTLMRSIPIENFVGLIMSPQGDSLLETYWDPSVRVHDNLATVWLQYNFYIGERLDHCGEDAFQLFRSDEGWKIIAIADTQRRIGCTPEEG